MSSGVLSGRDPATQQPLEVEYASGRITAVRSGGSGEGGYISPGLIDLQVNGFLGHDLNGGRATPDTVAELTWELRRRGVTTYLPTVVTASSESIIAAVRSIAEARERDARVFHAIPAIHIEGPWIASEDGPRGAHPREHVRAPDLEEFARWQDACGNLIGLVTLSPHFPETPAVTRALASMGVTVSIGHTGATAEQVRAALDAGARLSTHLGNGAAAMLPRHPNFIWTQLADERSMACFIADGHHLPGDTLKAMLRAKGIDRSILVSDTTALGGMPPGTYDQPIGGKVELSRDGRLSLAGTPYLAGAALPLPEVVARATRLAEISLDTSLRLATVNPGKFAGGRGRLEAGADADLIRFDWASGETTLRIDKVLVRGEVE